MAVLRSGQPMVGLGNKRCKEDEKLINAALKEKKKGMIVDTRSQAAAINSKSKGNLSGISILKMYSPVSDSLSEVAEERESSVTCMFEGFILILI